MLKNEELTQEDKKALFKEAEENCCLFWIEKVPFNFCPNYHYIIKKDKYYFIIHRDKDGHFRLERIMKKEFLSFQCSLKRKYWESKRIFDSLKRNYEFKIQDPEPEKPKLYGIYNRLEGEEGWFSKTFISYEHIYPIFILIEQYKVRVKKYKSIKAAEKGMKTLLEKVDFKYPVEVREITVKVKEELKGVEKWQK